jgi:hypothetical protein
MRRAPVREEQDKSDEGDQQRGTYDPRDETDSWPAHRRFSGSCQRTVGERHGIPWLRPHQFRCLMMHGVTRHRIEPHRPRGQPRSVVRPQERRRDITGFIYFAGDNFNRRYLGGHRLCCDDLRLDGFREPVAHTVLHHGLYRFRCHDLQRHPPVHHRSGFRFTRSFGMLDRFS